MARNPNLDKLVFITVAVFFRDIFSKENCLTRSKNLEAIVLNKWRGTAHCSSTKYGDQEMERMKRRDYPQRPAFLGGRRLQELRKVGDVLTLARSI